jgi:hypothetical protein
MGRPFPQNALFARFAPEATRGASVSLAES